MLELNFHPFPVIETDRLLLRWINENDIDTLFRMRSDKEMMKYIDKPLAQTREDVLPLYQNMVDGIKNNTGISWIIELKEIHTVMGQIGFWRIDKDNHRGEIGYNLLPEFHRKGFGTEALAAALDFGFENLHFHSVEANVNTANESSIWMLQKQGFVREALFRENYYFDGRFLDSAIYCLLAADRT